MRIGIERRHDLARIAIHALRHDLARLPFLEAFPLHRGLHLRVMEQPVNQDLAPGQLELRQLQVEAGVDLPDHPVDLVMEVPAHARHQQAIEHGPGCQQQQDDEQPGRQGNGGSHSGCGPKADAVG
jgi:hypothetical protein